MLRYIMRHNWKHANGASGMRHYTIDGDADRVEQKLSEGGFDEDAFDHHEFVGIEIIHPQAGGTGGQSK